MLLIDAIPDVAADLATGLMREGRPELAGQVGRLQLADRCRCGDASCAAFATEIIAPWPDSAERVIIPMQGLICVFVVAGRIAYVELSNRPEVRTRLLDLFP